MEASDSGLRPSTPRLAPLRNDELDDRQRRLAGEVSGQFTGVPDVVLTLLRHPALYEAFLPLATQLLNHSAFDDRRREMIILRTAVVVGSAYEWAQHVNLSRGVLSPDEVDRIAAGPAAAGWSPAEATLLQAVEELAGRGGITDATWSSLAADLDERQLVELPVLIGQYQLIALVCHALGVQPEEGSAEPPW